MNSLIKKLGVPFLAAISAACLCLGTAFTFGLTASAASADSVVLDSPEYFLIGGDGRFSGLSEAGEAKTSGGYFSIELPASVKRIEDRAMMDNAYLTEITIPDGIEQIGDNSFSGCTSLSKVTLPATVDENIFMVGTCAFEGCSSLSSINLPEGLTDISTRTFNGCSSLLSVTIPSTVSEISSLAFNDCVRLIEVCNKSSSLVIDNSNNGGVGAYALNVYNPEEGGTKLHTDGDYTFYEDGEQVFLVDYSGSEASLTLPADYNGKAYGIYNGAFINDGFLKSVQLPQNLKSIGISAFENCSGLEYIEIPSSVTEVKESAFKGCTSLNTVYLPDNATFGENVFDLNGCPVLIAPDANAYDKYTKYPGGLGLFDYRAFVTYEVEVNLVYGEGKHSVTKLYNLGYGYALQGDGKTWLNNGGMPVQEGYKTSVWYKESTYSNKATSGDLDAMLKNQNDITLYAHSVEQPVLTAKNNLVYSPEGISFGDALDGWTGPNEAYAISVTDYEPFSGKAPVPEAIKDAGVYTVSVVLDAENYGEWEKPCTAQVTVARAEKNLADLQWASVSEANRLSPLSSTAEGKPLYIYNNIPYFDEDTTQSAGAVKEVINSYATYTGASVTVASADDKNHGGDLQVNYLSGNTATEAGVYTLTAEILYGNNYAYNPDKFNPDSEQASKLGMKCNVSETDGSWTVTVSKTWYIVSANSNRLLGTNGLYSVTPLWVYGRNAFVKPDVSMGEASELVTFILERSELNADSYKVIGNSDGDRFAYNDFDNVLNASMPVGDYRLTIILKDYTHPNGTVYEGGKYEYLFTIENYPSAEKLAGLEVDEMYEVRYSDNFAFPELKGFDGLDGADKLHKLPEGANVWANYPEYYTGFEITYYVMSEHGASGGYYTEAEYAEGIPQVTPGPVGVYTVYYRVSAPGYSPLSGNNKFYTLLIYRELNVEAIQKDIDNMYVPYTGKAVNPDIYTEAYRAEYLSGCDYINVGSYPVNLVIWDVHYVENYDRYLYRWSNTTGVSVQVMLTVDKAENNTKAPLTVTEWEYGAYNPVVNAISWSTDWVTDKNAFTFELVPEQGGTGYVLADFGKADSGKYILKATCPGSANYKDGYEEIAVTVSPARIVWQTAPYINSWKYGDFNDMFVMPEPVLKSTVRAVESEILDGAYFLRVGKTERYSTVEELIGACDDENGELPAGNYMLVYSYDKAGNYDKFEYVVSFQVLKADNYWDVAPVVYGWSYGDKSIDYLTYKPDFVPHYGDAKKVVIQYRTLSDSNVALSGWEYRLADLGLDVYGKLNVGNYEVKATMSGSDNYESMEFVMSFKVTKSQNSWDEIPNVVSWNAGRINSIEDVLTVIPANGYALITILNSDGEIIVENELPEDVNINKLRSLEAGNYVLRAYVAETDAFDELYAEIDFAVFEDSVSQTALIALTAVFAVIAIALAVVAIVLLVRREKKIEAEFRNMIKAELRRK